MNSVFHKFTTERGAYKTETALSGVELVNHREETDNEKDEGKFCRIKKKYQNLEAELLTL